MYGDRERTRSTIASNSALANEKRLFFRPRIVSSPSGSLCRDDVAPSGTWICGGLGYCVLLLPTWNSASSSKLTLRDSGDRMLDAERQGELVYPRVA